MVRERKLLRKTYTSRPLLGWRTLLRRSRADREFRNLDSLRAIEVPCVEVVDWRETRAFGCVASCSLDSVYLPNSGDLQSVLRRASDPAERRELATALGRLLHHMHDRGVCSTTMSLRNVLVHDGARLAICDQPFALFLRTGRLSRRLAQVDLHDFNCGYKAYRREVLEQIAIYGELHRYIPVLASRRGFRIGEIEVTHHPRRHGVSKYGWDRFYKGLLDLITVLFITKYTRRPLHLFGMFGLVFLATGFCINIYLAYLWWAGEPLSRRPLLLLGVLLMVMGVQVLTTGLLGEMITFKNFRRRDSYSVRERLE